LNVLVMRGVEKAIEEDEIDITMCRRALNMSEGQ
jgi:hypothetical protein